MDFRCLRSIARGLRNKIQCFLKKLRKEGPALAIVPHFTLKPAVVEGIYDPGNGSMPIVRFVFLYHDLLWTLIIAPSEKCRLS
jgi:hypothetical protein